MPNKTGLTPKVPRKQRRGRATNRVAPSISPGVGQAAVVSNRELLAEITMPTTKDGVATGTVTVVPCLMPWLVNVASSYQSYAWKHIRVTYSPMVGELTPGIIAMGRSHDLNDKTPSTLAQMASQASSCIGRISQGCPSLTDHQLGRPMPASCLGFDLPLASLKQVGAGSKLDYMSSATYNAATVDVKDRHTDMVVQWLTTGGTGTGEKVGFLWFQYVVELSSPTPYGINY